MKAPDEIRLEETKKCEGYTNRQLRYNLIIYNFFKFLFSRTFMFIFYAVLISILYMFMTIPIENKLVSGLITHFILFIFVDPMISKYVGVDYTRKEIDILIEVNKEILEQRKNDSV
jgi:hypothetical protein